MSTELKKLDDAGMIILVQQIALQGFQFFVKKENGKGLFSGDYGDLSNKPDLTGFLNDTQVTSKISGALTAAGYQTGPQVDSAIGAAIAQLALFSGAYGDLSGKPDLSVYQSAAQVLAAITNQLTTGNYTTASEMNTAISQAIAAQTLFSGDYGDLSNKPDLSVLQTATQVNGLIAAALGASGFQTAPQVEQLISDAILLVSQFDGNYSSLKGVPTKLSDFSNDAGFQNGTQVASAISSATSGFQTQSQVEQIVDTKVALIDTDAFKVVATLPAVSAADKGKFYLAPNAADGGKIWVFIVEGSAWVAKQPLEITFDGVLMKADLAAIPAGDIITAVENAFASAGA